jgi:DNA-binding Lrp family transcriptional regulator
MNGFVTAYLVANVKQGTEHKVAQLIRKMEEVTEVLVTYGLWDLVVRIEATNLGHLDKIITDIRQIESIEQTSTLIGSA